MNSNNNGAKFTCVDCTLHDACIPRHVDRSQLDVLENIIKRSRILHKGDYLHREGDPIKSIYILRSGAVKEYISTDGGDEQILGFFLPGELIGLDSLTHKCYRCAAIALETTTYCALPLNKFEQLCQKMPSLQKMMFDTMSKVISFEEKMLLTACNKKAEERLSTFLMSLSKRYLHLGYSATEIHLPMSRQEIGNYLGLSSETISRVLTKLQKDKIIFVGPKVITVTDMPSLQELSQECSAHKIIEHHVN